METIKRGEESEPFTVELSAALIALWKDRAVSEVAVKRGNEYQLVESATQYKFFNKKVKSLRRQI